MPGRKERATRKHAQSRKNPREVNFKNCCYVCLYAIATALLAAAVGSCVGYRWEATPQVAEAEAWLRTWIVPGAIGAMVGLVGLTGAAFAWLITNAERRVCGTRMGDLVDWVYPGFFRFYFLVFAPLSLLGVYAGHAGWVWTCLYAGMGVSLGMALLARACYVFVVQAGLRENWAFDYYRSELKDAGSYVRKGARSAERRTRIEQILLNLADYARFLTLNNHRPAGKRLVELWMGAVRTSCFYRGGVDLCFDYLYGIPDGVLKGAELSQRIWDALLDQKDTPGQRRQILHGVLPHLCMDGEADLSAYIALLLGLLAHLEIATAGDACPLAALARETAAVAEGQPEALRRDLGQALAVFLAVAWLSGAPDALPAADQAWAHFGPPPVPGETEYAEALLLYAEWLARVRYKLPLDIYLFRLSGEPIDTMGGIAELDLEDTCYREAFLTCLFAWRHIPPKEGAHGNV